MKRTLGNSIWLAADQVFRMGVSLVVGVWVARYLGPDRYGVLNFSGAFCAPFAALLLGSINALVVRDLVKEPGKESAILGTVAILKLIGAGMGLLIGGTLVMSLSTVDERALPLVMIVLAGSVFTAGEVSDLWLQSQRKARVSAWVRSGASFTASLGKILLVVLDGPLVWFAAMGAFEVALCALGWAWSVRRLRHGSGGWHWDGSRARRLLSESWPLLVGGGATLIQAYYDQILLGSMRTAVEVGYYAAALRLVVLMDYWPMAIRTAVAPEITQAFHTNRGLYARRLRDVYRVMLGIFCVVSVPMIFLPDMLIHWTFGEGFAASAALLPLLAGRLLMTNLGVARGLNITNEGLFKHAMFTALFGMGLNIILNYLLIPRYGAQGCVIASVISFSANTLLFEWFHPKARFGLKVLGAALGFCRLPQ